MASATEEGKSSLKSFNRVTLHILKRMLDDSQNRNSASFPIIQRAYISLKACPVPFQRIDDLSQLSGFESEAFRKELGSRLEKWCDANGKKLSTSLLGKSGFGGITNGQASSSGKSKQKQSTLSGWSADKDDTSQPQKATSKRKKAGNSEKDAPPPTRQYIPQHRTGTHGILVALYGLTPGKIHADGDESNKDDDSYFSKAVIISHAQAFSDAKYIPAKAPPGFGHSAFSFHSAWSGMKTLINRGCVFRKGNPARFGLSEQGLNVARTCAEKEKEIMQGCFAEEGESRTQKTPSEDNVVIPNSKQVDNEAVSEREDEISVDRIPHTSDSRDALRTKSKRRRRDLLDTSSADEGEALDDCTDILDIHEDLHCRTLRPSKRMESRNKNTSKASDTVKTSKILPATPINLISSDDMEISKENNFQATSLESPSPLYGRQHQKRMY